MFNSTRVGTHDVWIPVISAKREMGAQLIRQSQVVYQTNIVATSRKVAEWWEFTPLRFRLQEMGILSAAGTMVLCRLILLMACHKYPGPEPVFSLSYQYIISSTRQGSSGCQCFCVIYFILIQMKPLVWLGVALNPLAAIKELDAAGASRLVLQVCRCPLRSNISASLCSNCPYNARPLILTNTCRETSRQHYTLQAYTGCVHRPIHVCTTFTCHMIITHPHQQTCRIIAHKNTTHVHVHM